MRDLTEIAVDDSGIEIRHAPLCFLFRVATQKSQKKEESLHRRRSTFTINNGHSRTPCAGELGGALDEPRSKKLEGNG